MTDHKMGEKVLSEPNLKGEDGKLVKVIDLAQSTWGPGKPEAVHNVSLDKNAAVAGAHDMSLTAQREAHKGEKHAHGDKVEQHGHDRAHLLELSHKIKLLNNELHKPGGPLAKSDLELVGFDKSGRLLLIHRDHSGKVDGKFLVDGDSGRIVGRTEPGHLDKWEHGPGYDKVNKKMAPEAKTQKPGQSAGKLISGPDEITRGSA